MRKYWNNVYDVVRDSDVILYVLDARFIEETRDRKVERTVNKPGKVLIHVINKCDLANKEDLEKIKRRFKRCVFVSSTKYYGMGKLKERIIIEGKRLGKEKPQVGVVGVPNVGKSAIINCLGGRKSASTSPISGYTRGKQNIKGRKFTLIDTPGVFSYKGKPKDSIKTGIKDAASMKDPEKAFDIIFGDEKEKLKRYFGVDEDNSDDFLEKLAEKKGFMKKGNVGDTKRAAKHILSEVQRKNVG